MSVRDDIYRLLDEMPEERLADISVYLQRIRDADAAWDAWEADYGSPELDAYVIAAVAEEDADPSPPIPHEKVKAWIESMGTDHELPPPFA